MLFTGWEVHIGRNCAQGLEYRPRPYSDRGHSFSDLDWWIAFLFFSYWDLKVSGKFSFTLHSAMCDEVGRVNVDEVHDIFQNKTLQHDF